MVDRLRGCIIFNRSNKTKVMRIFDIHIENGSIYARNKRVFRGRIGKDIGANVKLQMILMARNLGSIAMRLVAYT